MTDIDPVAVSRACAGDRTVSLNRAEVAAAVAHLHAQGSNQRETARTLGLHERTVARTVARIVHGETTVPQSRPGRVA